MFFVAGEPEAHVMMIIAKYQHIIALELIMVSVKCQKMIGRSLNEDSELNVQYCVHM